MITLNHDQDIALLKFKIFLNSNDQVFILKGYAGTGKTTMIKEMIAYLNTVKRQPILMASTGRAARILFEKTNFPSETVHRTIYHIEETGVDEELEYRYTRFALHTSEVSTEAVFLCDESSMLSNKLIFSNELSFGSGRLLADLITHIGKRKIVFVGDPSQLPPINSFSSPALSSEFFKKEFDFIVHEASLTQIMRYKANSGKYENTVRLREAIEENRAMNNPKIYARGKNDIHVYSSEDQLVISFAALVKVYGIDQMCCIAHSNNKVFELNFNIRRILFKGKTHKINIGEPLLIIQNNYLFGLFNGDSVEVIEVKDEVENRVGIDFRWVEVQTFDKDGMVRKKCLIVDNLLHMNLVGLNNEQETKLYQDFVIRMKNIGVLEKTEKFIYYLKNDMYLNALKVKFGYAMTCHKAQGGEWPHVFLSLDKYLFVKIPKPELHRWLYTALSRASNNVYIANNLCIV
jgi:ATP-dependent exoDNAse (exonuclease V) alpha subunit